MTSPSSSPRGTLFVVATPLGHLDDLSPRAIETLRSVARIACEDTRRTAGLLQRFDIRTPLTSCHKFNERERLAPLLSELRGGRDIALVSDGGTPAISDPGGLLVAAVVAEGHEVVPIPGPSAVVTLLSIAGLPADRFVFEGFLPHRAGERRRRLREVCPEPRTWVFFESPRRIRATLRDLMQILGERDIVLGRELTKVHETILRGSARSVLASLGDGEVRGEIVVGVRGGRSDDRPSGDAPEAERLGRQWRIALAEADGSRRDALRRFAKALGVRRAEAWRVLTEVGLVGPGSTEGG